MQVARKVRPRSGYNFSVPIRAMARDRPLSASARSRLEYWEALARGHHTRDRRPDLANSLSIAITSWLPSFTPSRNDDHT